MSKYAPLAEHLASLGTDVVDLSFTEIEGILNFELPRSARKYPEWWANSRSNDTHTSALLWSDAGWQVDSLNLSAIE